MNEHISDLPLRNNKQKVRDQKYLENMMNFKNDGVGMTQL
jgi:hypothetical protein